MGVTLHKPSGLRLWLQTYRLYRQAFPPAERKPFSVIVKMARRGKTDVWCLKKDGSFVGFATTINGPDAILLDYLAVEAAWRGKGIGSETLYALQAHYRGKGLFVEIESVYEPGDDRRQRVRRRQFYQDCGMEPFGVMANVFGVKMELLGCGCRLNFAEYQRFYREQYSPWAAEHLSEAPYPENMV